MPHTYLATFCARYHEADAFGHLHYANYLRYMQESAFAASADVGYGEARYTELGYQWLAYETDIAYFAHLRYHDAFEIKTWVHDFRRVRSLRSYRFLRAGEMIAQASTDWVFIDMKTLRPTAIPSEMVAAYAQGDTVEAAPRHDSLPSVPPPDHGVFVQRRRVSWCEIDPVGHVNNSVYVHYAEDCGAQVRRAYGWPVSRLHEMGYRVVTRRHKIEYKLPALVDDDLEIATWLSHIEPDSALRHYTITRVSDGALLTRIRARVGWENIATGQPAIIPPAFLRDLAENIAG